MSRALDIDNPTGDPDETRREPFAQPYREGIGGNDVVLIDTVEAMTAILSGCGVPARDVRLIVEQTVEGLTVPELAERHGTTANAVWKIRHYAFAKVRERMNYEDARDRLSA